MSACHSIFSGFFSQPKLLLGLLCYEDDSFTILLRFNQDSAVSRQICQKWKGNKRDSCGTRGMACGLDSILLCIIMHAQ